MPPSGIGLIDETPTPAAAPAAPAAQPVSAAQQLPAAQADPAARVKALAPKFADNPIGAVGFLLQQFSAGLQGRELPSTRLAREALAQQQMELEQLQVGAQVLDKGLAMLERAPAEQRQQVIDTYAEGFGDSMPGLKQMLTDLSANIPDARKVAKATGEFGPQLYAMCGNDVDCIRKMAADEGFMKQLQSQRDRKNKKIVGAKLREITNIMHDRAESIGFERDDMGDFVMDMADLERINDLAPEELQLSSSEMATIERNPEILLRYGIKTPELMEFEAKELFKSRLRIREAQVTGQNDRTSDLLDERGAVKSEVSNAIHKRMTMLLGGQVDPLTGLIPNLTQEMAREAQDLTRVATALLQSGRATNMDEAVAMATGTGGQPGATGSALPDIPEPEIPISKEKRETLLDQNAEIARILPMVEGRIDAAFGTGFWSNVMAGVNSLAQVVGTEAFPDNSTNRQKLREMNNDIKRALANNPKFNEGEQRRILELLPKPEDIFKNPQTAERDLRSLVGFLRGIESSNTSLLQGKRPEAPQRDFGSMPMGELQNFVLGLTDEDWDRLSPDQQAEIERRLREANQ